VNRRFEGIYSIKQSRKSLKNGDQSYDFSCNDENRSKVNVKPFLADAQTWKVIARGCYTSDESGHNRHSIVDPPEEQDIEYGQYPAAPTPPHRSLRTVFRNQP
jgi:hypothetical protein